MLTRMRGLSLLILASSALPAPALAQSFRSSEQAQVLLPIARDPAVSASTAITFSSRDDSSAELTLPFPIYFLGEPHTQVSVGTNGYLLFGGARATSSYNRSLGSATTPERALAVWWDDLIMPSASGHADWAVVGTAPQREVIIEVRDLERYSYSANPEIAWQVRLHEGAEGQVDLFYSGTPSETYNASVGYIGSGGTPQSALRSCAGSASCTASDFSSLAGRRIRIEQVPGPDLRPVVGAAPAGGLRGAVVPLPVTLGNVGTEAPSATVEADVYLSSDDTLDAQDYRLARVSFPAVAARASVTRTATLSLGASVPTGSWRVLVSADPRGLVTEPDESNNVVALTGSFEIGHDLVVGVPVASMTAAGAGSAVSIDVVVSEQGLPYTGDLDVVVFAGGQPSPSGTGPVMYRGTPSFANGSAQLSLPAVVPSGAAPRVWPIVQIDPDGRIEDRDRSNDRAVAASALDTLPNFRIGDVSPAAGAAPGSALSVQVRVDNPSAPTFERVRLVAYVSADPVFDGADMQLGEVSFDSDGSSQQTVTVSGLVPSLPVGRYYVIGEVDADGVVAEVSEADNAGVSSTTFATAPNVALTRISRPYSVSPGFSISATFYGENDGIPQTGTIPVGWWLSEDQVLDAADVALGTFSVSASAGSFSASPSATVPTSLPSRQWYVLAMADPDQNLAEADETDNFLAASSPSEGRLDLRPSSIRVSPSSAGATETVSLGGYIYSSGRSYGGPVGYRVSLSSSGNADSSNLVVHSATVTMDGNRYDFAESFALPSAVRPGTWYVVVEVDPSDVLLETDETNNADASSGTLAVPGPDLVPGAASAPSQVLAGEAFDFIFDVTNAGGRAAPSSSYRVELLAPGAASLELASGDAGSIGAGSRVPVSVRLTVPTSVSGSVELSLTLDGSDVVDELEEGNNASITPVEVRSRRADLRPVLVRAATVTAAGEPWTVEWAAENLGVEPVSGEVAIYLGIGASETDMRFRVATSTLTLGSGEAALVSTSVIVPEAIPGGTYRLGLVADPSGAIAELDETNNFVAGPWVELSPASLRVVTATLAPAYLGRAYEQTLDVVGGRAAPTWSLNSGSTLPAGLSLSADGRLFGTPTAVGQQSFELVVVSGAEEARRTLTLSVLEAGAPLAVGVDRLGPAWVDTDYVGQVVVVGGVPPLAISVVGLPSGFEADASGRVSGRSGLPFRGTLTVSVTDALGQSVSRSVGFAVLDPEQRISILPTPLPEARLGADYCAAEPISLLVIGGTTPLTWSATDLPPGMTLSSAGGLCGSPTALGTYSFSAQVVDAVGDSDDARFVLEVVSASTLVLVTAGLPPVTVSEPFSFLLEADGGTAPYKYSVASGALPDGASLVESGTLSGQIAAEGVWSFGLEVVDAAGSSRTFALSLEARASSDDGGGCRCVGEPRGRGGMLLGLFGLLGLIRRVGRWRRR